MLRPQGVKNHEVYKVVKKLALGKIYIIPYIIVMRILITGANGYIGTRLLLSLAPTGHEVVAVVRNEDRISRAVRELYGQRLTIVERDFMESVNEQGDGSCDVDAAYYLIHSMGGEDFENREIRCAENFLVWMKSSACRQIIYLSGLRPIEEKLSSHLASRERVYDILSAGMIPLTTLRASIIVGSGSASFEIIRDLIEKLPVMITPSVAHTECQPIAIRNVLEYLTGVILCDKCMGRDFDIGGPSVMSYLAMLKRFATERGLKRWVIGVPFFSARLCSYGLTLLTSTNYRLARTLTGSLHMKTVCQENHIRELIPTELISYEQAIERAFSKIAQNRVPSTWYGALSTGRLNLSEIRNIKMPEYGILTDRQVASLSVSREEVVNALWSLGGKNGWPNMLWAWRLRGLLDKMVGGIGMRRGRRSVNDLKPGDALDFWRVIVADKDQGRLMLYAEMRLPGEAWLEFSVSEGKLHQTATFRPLGLFGRVYWYVTYPLHLFLFPKMVMVLASGWKTS